MRMFPWLVFVVILSCSITASAQTLRVSAEQTSLRDRPATDGAMVAAVEKGAELQLLERAGTWFRVRVNGTGAEGYVHSLMVESSSAAAPSTAAAPAMPEAAAPPVSSAAAPAMASQAPAASGSRIGFALKGGITQASFFGADVTDEFGRLKRRTGLTFGAALGVPIGAALSIQPEVLLTEKGTKSADDEDEAINLRYLEIPVLIKWTFGQSGSASPFVYAGPAFSLRLGATLSDIGSGREPFEEDISEEIKGTDLGLVFGGGIALGHFTAEARVTRGLSTIDANLEARRSGPDDVKNTALTLLLGFSFGSQ